MAGKSGRTISAVPEKAWKRTVFSWEGIMVAIFLAVNILCICISPSYQLKNVLREMPKYLAEMFLMFPMVYILILGDIDLTVGATVCFAASMGCMASNAGAPIVLVLILMLAVGTACGLVNGLVLTRFTELPSMIVTLATQIIFRGIAEISLGSGGSISLTNYKSFKVLAGKIGIVPYVFFLVLIVGIIFAVILAKTAFGRRLYAIGSNSTAAQYAGVHVQKIRLIVFTVTGLLSGLGAIFLTAVQYSANTTTGQGFELDVIAMAVFGGVSTAGGKGKMAGAMISAFTITCLRIGLGQINMNAQLILIILGILLILAVMLPNIVTMLKNQRRMAVK